ncbi:MAG: 16S rRNA (adenine(1518)-N(6)/adenine(1519)-N(6))-dimethyltransferase RsmA [Gammaproteobacteria bacterium]|nr:16S rRNA (adenine(1518)-N(6)/adenine(1519)-N(6))-dimethyltransferase RsmA [Gammaproteobacteria bacterium]
MFFQKPLSLFMHKPRKRFGQHFLHDQNIIHRMIDTLSPTSSDVIIEIGPGKGALTFSLLMQHPNLIAIEIDRDLVERLMRMTKSYSNFTLIQSDVLNFDFSTLPPNQKIIGNLPYNISTPLLFHLLEYKNSIRELIFMLQKEVVERMCAEVNTPDYGRLSIMLQRDFEIESLFDVPNTAFDPPPQVESAVVRLMPKSATKLLDYTLFSDIVREAFQYRRKTLRHALGRFFSEADLEKNGISSKSRPAELTLHDFEKLANYLVTEQRHV